MTSADETATATLAGPRGREKSLGFGLRDSILVVLMTLLWLPSLSTLGQSDMNAYFVLAALLLLLLLARLNRLSVGLASRFDAWALTAVLASALALSAFAFVSAAYAEIPHRVFRVIAGQLFGIAIVGTMISLPPSAERFRRYVEIFLWGATLSSAFAAASYFVPALNEIAFGDRDRTSAFFKNPNQFGMALSMAVPIVVAYCVVDRNKMFRLAQLATIYLGLAFSGSKANLATSAALAMAALFFTLLRSGALKRHPGRAFLLISVAIGAGVLGYFMLGDLNPRAQRLLAVTASGEAISSWESRQRLWSVSIADGVRNPWGGVGAGQYVRGTDVHHSHNVFLEQFRTMGVPGVALLTALIFGAMSVGLSSIFRRNKVGVPLGHAATGAALGLSVLGYIFTNQFSDSFGPSTLPLFWVILGLLFYFRRNLRYALRGGI